MQDNALLTKLNEAVVQKNQQCAALQELEAVLPPEKASQWTAQVEAWKANREGLNPYRHKQEGMAASQYVYIHVDILL